MARKTSANEAFHDRYARSYDQTYASSEYWRLYRTLTWNHLRRYLPRTLPAQVLDLGCGTGEWGLRLLKSGFQVCFVDLSQKMVDQAERKAREAFPRAEMQFLRADLQDLSELEQATYAFATAQGDPISMCERPLLALQQIARVLQPGSVLVASVDGRAAQVDAYIDRGDIDGLETVARRGSTEFLTRRVEERFPLHAFEIEELEKLLARTGFELVDIIGKTVLPLRKHETLLKDAGTYKRLLKLEEELHRSPSWLARASHYQFAARKREGGTEDSPASRSPQTSARPRTKRRRAKPRRS